MVKARNIIIQAGGRGSRMGHLTDNKPKCLVPLYGKPILYSISNAFDEKLKVTIIEDYKADVLESYLNQFPPPFDYSTVRAEGKGTCAGVQTAIENIGNDAFILIWSDLFFTRKIKTERNLTNIIGVSNEIKCRWSYINGTFVEEPNDVPGKLGIPGIFFFGEPRRLPEIPKSGEFVRFLADNHVAMTPRIVEGVKEIGTLESYNEERNRGIHSRFFNDVEVRGDKVIKKARDSSFSSLIRDEVNWYRYVSKRGFTNIPKVISYNPLTLGRIHGSHPFELVERGSISLQEKRDVVIRIFDSLDELHKIDRIPYDHSISRQVYVEKTLKRIAAISGIIPNNNSDYFIVEGVKVPNLLVKENVSHLETLFSIILKYSPHTSFELIHGDPTFSNILIEQSSRIPIFIDPRGYFGSMKLYGDSMYDYAKLYYSAIGNYDFFNQGKFYLKMNNGEVNVKISSEGFEGTEGLFYDYLDKHMPAIKGLHALIWISLSGYVTDDFDAMLASYFHGLWLLREALYEFT